MDNFRKALSRNFGTKPKNKYQKAGSEMALPLLVSPTYSGSGILLKSCVTCYFT
jgi:hypothetical protein